MNKIKAVGKIATISGKGKTAEIKAIGKVKNSLLNKISQVFINVLGEIESGIFLGQDTNNFL